MKERKEAKEEEKAKKKPNHAIPIYYQAYDIGNCAFNIRCVFFKNQLWIRSARLWRLLVSHMRCIFFLSNIIKIDIYGLHIVYISNIFKIDRKQNARRYETRAYGACLCHRRIIVCLSNFLKIDTYGDA
jgi:hypothetical protein